ncbi:MAG: hypothetical protein AB2693_26300 [Candidatus Thiodiazotropha sp.]
MLLLYKGLVAPQLEYAAAVWHTGNCNSLDKVQRKGLAVCFGVQETAGIDALKVEAGIKPPEIRREELAMRQAEKIMMKDDKSCIKMSWDKFTELDIIEHKISPFGRMNI